MVARTAKQGKYKGKSFWGCSKYDCKGLIDIEGKVQETGGRPLAPKLHANPVQREKKPAKPATKRPVKGQDSYAALLTREFHAREYRRGYEAFFYQNIAVPSPVLKELSHQPKYRNEIQRFSGWRLDLPSGQAPEDQITLNILAGIMKILLRGKITLLSPFAEEELNKHYGEPEPRELLPNLSFLFAQESVGGSSGWWFDGYGANPPEKVFHDVVLPMVHPSGRLCAIPQVYLQCLTKLNDVDETGSKQRVDFLLTNGNKGLIIELDDSTHVGHDSRDELRAIQTNQGGFPTLRIASSDLANSPKKVAKKVRKQLSDFPEIAENHSVGARMMVMAQLLHQLEISVIMAMWRGVLKPENSLCQVDVKSMGLDREETRLLCHTLEMDLSNMLQNYACLYDGSPEFRISVEPYDADRTDGGAVFTKDDNLDLPHPVVLIHNTFLPFKISVVIPSTNKYVDIRPDRDNVRYFLSHIFRKDDFFEGQYETVERALMRLDTVVLLPTGAGKSIAYQLAAFLLPGVALVVSPLISLMDDQLDNLQRAGIDSVIAISSLIENPDTKAKLIEAFGRREYLFAYITPERLQTEKFRIILRDLVRLTQIPLVAIDEAHCVSEWGHDFRTSYLNLGRVARDFCASDNKPPCIIALTGTASSAVLKDVQRELQMPPFDSVITPSTFDRRELHFSVTLCHSDAKAPTLHKLLNEAVPNRFQIEKEEFYSQRDEDAHCGIVFCPHVNGKHGIVLVGAGIRMETGVSAGLYSGKAPEGQNEEGWNIMKKEVANDFKNNRINLLCATKAFGMGIDKPNIRYTVHWGLPPSIESYYQEVGRAGRNRMDSYSYVLVSVENEEKHSDLFDMDVDHDQLDLKKKEHQDDIDRQMFFHKEAFAGVEAELEYINKVLEKLKISSEPQAYHRKFAVTAIERKKYEKALHRLVVLGVASDYTLDYANNEFGVQVSGIGYDDIVEHYKAYVRGYNVGRVGRELDKIRNLDRSDQNIFIQEMSKTLIEFIYDTVEKGRRKALVEMWGLAKEAAKAKNQDDTIRERVLRYFESTFTPVIEGILTDNDLGFKAIKELIDGYETETGELEGGVRSHKDSSAIRGQTARHLESTPDHPGLLFLRSLSEVFCRDYDPKSVTGNFFAAMDSLQTRYQANPSQLEEFQVWFLSKLQQRDAPVYEECVIRALETSDGLSLSSQIITSGEFQPISLYYPLVQQLVHLIGQVKDKFSIDS